MLAGAHPVHSSLTVVIHGLLPALADASILTVFRFLGLLDVLHEYDRCTLGRLSYQDRASSTSEGLANTEEQCTS